MRTPLNTQSPCPDNVCMHSPMELSYILAVSSSDAVRTNGTFIFLSSVKVAPSTLPWSEIKSQSRKLSKWSPSISNERGPRLQHSNSHTACKRPHKVAHRDTWSLRDASPDVFCRKIRIALVRKMTTLMGPQVLVQGPGPDPGPEVLAWDPDLGPEP